MADEKNVPVDPRYPVYPTPEWFPRDDFWNARASNPPNIIFESPGNLWAACVEYFNWNRDNPMYKAEVNKYMGDTSLSAVPKMRLMTVLGLCIFLGVTRQTWYLYRDRDGYDMVCDQVEAIMKHQAITGASGDFFNANIIARLLGLTDQQQITQSGPDGGPVKQEWTINIVRPKNASTGDD